MDVHPHAGQAVLDSFDVDDELTCAESLEEAVQHRKESQDFVVDATPKGYFLSHGSVTSQHTHTPVTPKMALAVAPCYADVSLPFTPCHTESAFSCHTGNCRSNTGAQTGLTGAQTGAIGPRTGAKLLACEELNYWLVRSSTIGSQGA